MIEELENHEDHGRSAGYSGLFDHRALPIRKREKHDVSLPALSHVSLANAKTPLLLPVGETLVT